MTVTSTASAVQAQGNGAATTFPFAFPIPGATPTDQTNVKVVITDQTVTPPTSTTLLNSQYSVTGISTVLSPSNSGTVTYPLSGSPLAAGQFITIQRNLPEQQTTSLPNQGPWQAKVVEAMIDYVTMLIQGGVLGISLALQNDPSDPAGAPATLPLTSLRKNQGAVWDANGNLIAGAVGSVPVNAAMTNLVQAVSILAARSFLQVAGLTDNNTFTGTETFNNLVTMGAALNETRGTIASAATVNIGAAPANYLQVTGVTTITAFDTIQAGARRILEFAGSLTLTNNASIILPGGANITTAAGDVAGFVSEGAGVWRCTGYLKASGAPVALSPLTSSLGADVTLAVGYTDGPSVAQGTAGTWLVFGTVTMLDTTGAQNFSCKLWDGTSIIDSGQTRSAGAANAVTISLMGVIAAPAGNLRISVAAAATSKMLFNQSGNSKDSTIIAVRIA